MKISVDQAAIDKWAETHYGTRRSLIVNCSAGSGKSVCAGYVALQTLERDSAAQVCYQAFGTRNIADMNQKIAELGGSRHVGKLKIATQHSLGASVIRRRVDKYRTKQIMERLHAQNPNSIAGVPWQFGLSKLIEKAQNAGVMVPDERGDTWWPGSDEWEDLAIMYDIDMMLPVKRPTSRTWDLVERWMRTLLEEHAKLEGPVTFGDQNWLPLVNPDIRPNIPKYDLAILDEFQDTNPTRRIFFNNCVKPNGLRIFFGDKRQCQPPGTKVRLHTGEFRNIEDLVPGVDQVTCFDRQSGAFVGTRNQGRIVSHKQAQHYAGPMYTVTAEGKSTRCTPNHKWLARFNNRSTEKYITYLMKRGEYYRVGWCQMFTKLGMFHLGSRATVENADAAWILGVHDSKQEASFAEINHALDYQLPQVMFKEAANNFLYTQKALDSFWSTSAERHSFETNARRLLEHYGRDIMYPIWSREAAQRRGRTTLGTYHTCNLLPDIMSILCYEQGITAHTVNRWFPVTLTTSYYEGLVWSLNVEIHHNYIADGLCTCNSIMGFAGADRKALQSIQLSQDCPVDFLSLPETFRLTVAGTDWAKQMAPEMRPWSGALPGEPPKIVEFKDIDPKPGDVILARNNRPLIDLFFKFMLAGRAVRIEGDEFALNMTTLHDKLHRRRDVRMLRLSDYRAYVTEEMLRLVQEYKDGGRLWKAYQIKDEYASLIRIIDFTMQAPTGALDKTLNGNASPFDEKLQFDHRTIDTVSDIIHYVTKVSGDNDTARELLVTLSTAHKSKGLSFNDVYWYAFDTLHPSKHAKTPEDFEQERNLEYVCRTRAKNQTWLVKTLFPEDLVDELGEEMPEPPRESDQVDEEQMFSRQQAISGGYYETR